MRSLSAEQRFDLNISFVSYIRFILVIIVDDQRCQHTCNIWRTISVSFFSVSFLSGLNVNNVLPERRTLFKCASSWRSNVVSARSPKPKWFVVVLCPPHHNIDSFITCVCSLLMAQAVRGLQLKHTVRHKAWTLFAESAKEIDVWAERIKCASDLSRIVGTKLIGVMDAVRRLRRARRRSIR